jgi:hypothetical protein
MTPTIFVSRCLIGRLAVLEDQLAPPESVSSTA